MVVSGKEAVAMGGRLTGMLSLSKKSDKSVPECGRDMARARQ